MQSYLEAFLHTSLLPGAIVRDVDITLIRSHGTISILFWDARMAESAQQVLNRDAAVDGIRADLISHHRVQSVSGNSLKLLVDFILLILV